MAKPFQALLLKAYTIAIITAHLPGQHMWVSLPWPYSKCSKTVEGWKSCLLLRFKTVIVRSPRNLRKNNIESSTLSQQCKRVCVSALTGSVLHKMAQGKQVFQQIREQNAICQFCLAENLMITQAVIHLVYDNCADLLAEDAQGDNGDSPC